MLYNEEFRSSWGLSWWRGRWVPWRWKIFYQEGSCELGTIPFRLESQKVSQPAITCPVTHCCPFCCGSLSRSGLLATVFLNTEMGSPSPHTDHFLWGHHGLLEFWLSVVPKALSLKCPLSEVCFNILFRSCFRLRILEIWRWLLYVLPSSPSLLFKIIRHCNAYLQRLIPNCLRMGITTFPLKKNPTPYP